ADVTIHEVLRGMPAVADGSGVGSQVMGERRESGATRPGARAVPGGPPARARAAALGDGHSLVAATELGLPAGRSAEEYFAVLSGLPAGEGDGPDRDPAWMPRQPGVEPGSDPSCGSGCDGLHRDYEVAGLELHGGLTQTQADAIREAVAIEFRDAARGRGDLPGEWARWVSQVLEPVVDWRNVLHAAVRRGLGWAHGHADYTYTRISRRQSVSGQVILPALRRPVPRVAVVVDTSGSVDDGLLAQALGEIDGVLAGLGVADAQVRVLAVDAAVHAVTSVSRASDVPLAGGGGTDMPLGIAAAQELRPRADVIIVLTDGFTLWPARPAEVPVIAVIIGRNPAALPRPPDWIQRVECVP
ncbi:MAG: VWA-like domain-containing protein, partial [Candidatus Nanopelagicales bacterium]